MWVGGGAGEGGVGGTEVLVLSFPHHLTQCFSPKVTKSMFLIQHFN